MRFMETGTIRSRHVVQHDVQLAIYGLSILFIYSPLVLALRGDPADSARLLDAESRMADPRRHLS